MSNALKIEETPVTITMRCRSHSPGGKDRSEGINFLLGALMGKSGKTVRFEYSTEVERANERRLWGCRKL